MAGYARDELRLVLIGKTGTGKSSAGNTILGAEVFEPCRGFNSVTQTCDWKKNTRNGISVQVTDTPGVCDTKRPKNEVHREIAKCVATLSPGPHAVLMVIKAGDRFTKEENDAYEELKRLFGDEITDFMIIVFTGIDLIAPTSIQKALDAAPPKVKEIIGEAHGRYIGFNNELPMSERVKQGDELISVVRKITQENRGRYYSNDLVQRVEDLLQAEMAAGKTREEIKEEIVAEMEAPIIKKVESKTKGRTRGICSVM